MTHAVHPWSIHCEYAMVFFTIIIFRMWWSVGGGRVYRMFCRWSGGRWTGLWLGGVWTGMYTPSPDQGHTLLTGGIHPKRKDSATEVVWMYLLECILRPFNITKKNANPTKIHFQKIFLPVSPGRWRFCTSGSGTLQWRDAVWVGGTGSSLRRTRDAPLSRDRRLSGWTRGSDRLSTTRSSLHPPAKTQL